MSDQTCPVHHIVTKLGHMIDSGHLKNPRNRWIAEGILTLCNDIAWGNAGPDHMPPGRGIYRIDGRATPGSLFESC